MLGATQIEYGGQSETLPLIIVKGHGASLFGCNWLEYFRLDWSSIHAVQKSDLLQKYATLFSDELGTLEKHSQNHDHDFTKQGNCHTPVRPRWSWSLIDFRQKAA